MVCSRTGKLGVMSVSIGSLGSIWESFALEGGVISLVVRR